jgi:hypothetical protein
LKFKLKYVEKATLSDAKKMCDIRDMGVLSIEKIVESDAVTDVLESLGLILFSLGAECLSDEFKQDCPQIQF